MQSDIGIATEKPARVSENSGLRLRFVGGIYYLGLCTAPFAMGGLLHLTVFETHGPQGTVDSAAVNSAGALTVLFLLMVLVPALALYRSSRRRLAFGTIWCLCLIAVLLVTVELFVRSSIPSWPALGLHGVPPEVARRAWAHTEFVDDDLNDWGQRDRHHAVDKTSGVYRIAFIGDSFLEESAGLPLSSRVETKIGRPDVEVINLGVSATDPDEYYYRIRNIAAALDVDHCVMCVYSGNDFSAPARTLETTAGMAAVYPRGSLLSSLGLHAVNHLFTNEQRPVLQAWFASGDLHAAESRLGSEMAHADDQGLRDLLYSMDYHTRNASQRSTLAARLNGTQMKSFFDVLRNPDQGRFRSYYLSAALWSASVGGGQWSPLSEDAAWHWVREAHNFCTARQIEFTLMIIPEAFQVDLRIIGQWTPLTDMQMLTETCRTSAARLVDRAASDAIRTIDLHGPFDGVSGTYLNMDGHWSDDGTELAADVVSEWLQSSLVSHSQ
ncbi:MAG TPA: hypothetical protein EYG03_21130 [Planctomycetes bacterium]|nr:hypothetical protein [Fuerstiella sp.]HIK94456.1 hypothetical protein [Planctomycetota bacterium]